MNPIKKRIMGFLEGKEQAEPEIFAKATADVPEMAELGRQAGADAIVYARKSKRSMVVLCIVGRSVLQGPQLVKYLEAYFSDGGGMKAHRERLATEIYEALRTQSDAAVILAAGDTKWMSFSPIKSVDEIYAAAGVE